MLYVFIINMICLTRYLLHHLLSLRRLDFKLILLQDLIFPSGYFDRIVFLLLIHMITSIGGSSRNTAASEFNLRLSPFVGP